jgi:hypothetical protein
MTEKIFWDYLRSKLRGHWQRIENLVDVGTPDVNGCVNEHEIWIELKVDLPGRQPPENLLEPSQKVWFYKRLLHGARNLFIFIRTRKKIEIWQPRIVTTMPIYFHMQSIDIPMKVNLTQVIEALCL